MAIGFIVPRPKNNVCSLSTNRSAIVFICVSIAKTSANKLGNERNNPTTRDSSNSAIFLVLANKPDNRSRTVSWVVNALVLATPISGPASVNSARSVSRTKLEVATLHIASVANTCVLSIWRRAESTSAVSPDCDMAIQRVFGNVTTLR